MRASFGLGGIVFSEKEEEDCKQSPVKNINSKRIGQSHRYIAGYFYTFNLDEKA